MEYPIREEDQQVWNGEMGKLGYENPRGIQMFWVAVVRWIMQELKNSIGSEKGASTLKWGMGLEANAILW